MSDNEKNVAGIVGIITAIVGLLRLIFDTAKEKKDCDHCNSQKKE